jgi:pimeloyl-ACP methyl ester carboxylesterase
MRSVVSAEGLSIAIHDPIGAGSDILFAHATGFHGLVWRPLARLLAADHRCWAFDFRGHGASIAPDDYSFDWNAFGVDVQSVVDALSLDRPIGIGHSKGATALLMAEIARPGMFRGLYLFEPITFPEGFRPEGGPSPMVVAARRRRPSFASRYEAYKNYASKPPLSVFHPDALRAYVDHGFIDGLDGLVHLACQPEHEARIFEMGAAHHTFERLGEVTCPVVVGCGAVGETPGPAMVAPLVADALPNGRLEQFDDLDHFGPLEDPARFAERIAALEASI